MTRRPLGRRLAHRLGAGTVAAILATALVAACTNSSEDANESSDQGWRYPGEEWNHVDPAEAGLSPAALDELAATAEAAGSTCLVVTRDGAVVDERSWGDRSPTTPGEVFSVTKSITSLLVGIAQEQGALRTDEPAATYITDWAGTDAEAVTIEDLLSNDSGRHWSIPSDYVELVGVANDKNEYAIGLEQDHAPGEVWAYNNSAIQTLSEVLETATGDDPVELARTELFEPIGMDDSELTTDPAGNALTFMGLQSTCLDLARFGYLALRDGAWEGEQIVSADFMEQATGTPSTPLNAAYGWLWWLNHQGPVGSPLMATTGTQDATIPDGRLVPDAPEDTFWALGFQNQIVAVIPSEGIVAVRIGAAPPAEAPFTQTQLTQGVLAALTAP